MVNGKYRVGTISIKFIRLPGFSDDHIRNSIASIVNGALTVASALLGKKYWVEPNEGVLVNEWWSFWRIDFPFYQDRLGSPFPVKLVIASILASAVIGAIIYWVHIHYEVEKMRHEEAMKELEIVNKIVEQKQEIIDKYTSGEITQEQFNQAMNVLNTAEQTIQQLNEEAKKEGKDWWAYLGEFTTKGLPLIIVLFIALTILSYTPRRRG